MSVTVFLPLPPPPLPPPGTLQGLSILANGMAVVEVGRVDASCSTFLLVHSHLAMLTIALLVGRGVCVGGGECRGGGGSEGGGKVRERAGRETVGSVGRVGGVVV